MAGKLLVIDTFGLIFRAYHAYPMLTTSEGKPTNAVFGFLQMLLTILGRYEPDYLVCGLESETPTFRHKLAADYKANRKEADPEMKVQIQDVIAILSTLNVATIQKNGFEADDVIGSFVVQHCDYFDQVQILTGDRDLFQLLSEKSHVLMPGRRFSDITEYDCQAFEQKYNLSLDDFVLYKSMIGDSSDNIKGIPGVGPKTAEKIVNKYHSIDSILANLDDLPPRIAESITEHKDLWQGFYDLCRIDASIDTGITPEETRISKLHIWKLRELVEKYELTSMQTKVTKFVSNFEKKFGSFDLFDTGLSQGNDIRELRYRIVEHVEFQKSSEEDMQNGKNETYVAYVITNKQGFLIGNGEEFIEVKTHEVYAFLVLHKIRSCIGYKLKPVLRALLDNGAEKLDEYSFLDVDIMWHLHRSDVKFDSINDLVKELQQDSFPVVYTSLMQKLEETGMINLFTLEQEIQVVLATMEWHGVKVNGEYLQALGKRYAEKIEKLKEKMFHLVGFEFNPASTKDLGHVLFEVLHLPVIKKTKTRYATDDRTLSKLEGTSDIIPLIRDFRMYSKTLSTYVNGLLDCVESDGRVHSTFNQTQVATGRFSSTNPNMQNLPSIPVIGNEIRKAFTPADEEHVFVSFDYSQIDLRVLAYETQDTELVKAFKKHEDIHQATDRRIFGKNDISKDERSFAKTVNFGIVYGMEPYGLSQSLQISQQEAKEFIEKYLDTFKGVREYFDKITHVLDTLGYVSTFMGRKRYFNSWKYLSGIQKRALFREAINMPIQGGTSEIMKLAMSKAHQYLKNHNEVGTIVLQIHDEIIIELHNSSQNDQVKEDIKNIMETVYDLGIPLVASVKEGKDLRFTS
ncbi:MAG: DNA polymerase [Candidatus Dojkabacteria bacterium]